MARPHRLPPLLIFCVTLLLTGRAGAHSDVYTSLPGDTTVIQFGLGDLSGDAADELAVLFTSGGRTRLAVFGARGGRWELLLEMIAPTLGLEAGRPLCLEVSDTNGDGRKEVLVYSLSEEDGSMITRILTLETAEGGPLSARVLLEDMTWPAGYPLFGHEGGLPSVTFLKMPSGDGEAGYRRVYCWEGGRFEECLEVPWVMPQAASTNKD